LETTVIEMAVPSKLGKPSGMADNVLMSIRGQRGGWTALMIPALVAVISLTTRAQESSADKSWSTSSQQTDPNGATNATRTRTTHHEVGGRTVETTVVEALGPEGRYVPYSEIERESVHVNDTTVRSVERSYGRDPNGGRTLTQETREESRSFPDGETKVSRTTSNADGNGELQVVQRALIDSKQLSPAARETKTTVFSADGSGSLAATVQIEERERKVDPATTEFTKSTSLADGAGHWTLSEQREGNSRQDAGGITKEERVMRPDSNGKLAMVERTVRKESTGGAATSEAYSTNVPGQAGDEGLQMVRRESTTQRTGAGGQLQTTKQVEQMNPGDPGAGLHMTQETIDIVRPGANGVPQQQSTIVTTDANGQVNAVWVDMGNSDQPAAPRVENKAATKQK
jgi:hypothetical protein